MQERIVGDVVVVLLVGLQVEVRKGLLLRLAVAVVLGLVVEVVVGGVVLLVLLQVQMVVLVVLRGEVVVLVLLGRRVKLCQLFPLAAVGLRLGLNEAALHHTGGAFVRLWGAASFNW